jgi:hypothetical protein
MAIIRIKRTTTSELPTGLTFGELAFVGASGGYTANRLYIAGPAGTCLWIGAQILNAPAFWDGITAQTTVPTVSAVFQNTVARVGTSGDWRKNSVAVYGATGGITLSGVTWAGSVNPVLVTQPSWGISAGTVLTGMTPMEILELMLVQYLPPSFSSFSIAFTTHTGVNLSSTTAIPIGLTLDNDSADISFATTNTTNIARNNNNARGATFYVASMSTGTAIQGDNISSASGLGFTANVASGSYVGFNPTVKYKGLSLVSNGSYPSVQFRIDGTNTQGTIFNRTYTYTFYPRMFYGWLPDTSLTHPPDAWKATNRVSGMTSGVLTTASNTTQPNITFVPETPGGSQYLYLWLHNSFTPASFKDNLSGFGFGFEPAVVAHGVTLDDGVTKQSYKMYRSTYALNLAQNITIGP